MQIARARLVLGYHRSLPGYTPTPLCELSHLAAKIGLDKIWVKDESKRFNLNAFKVYYTLAVDESQVVILLNRCLVSATA